METTPCRGHGGNCKNNAQFDGLCYFCNLLHPPDSCDHGGCTNCVREDSADNHRGEDGYRDE